MNRLTRLYAIAETLRAAAPRLVTVAQLAAEHTVSGRTVQRDLQALLESGVPVRWQDGRGGGWTVEASMTLPPVNLTEDEAAALLLAVRAASGATPLWPAAQSAWGKITAALDAAGSSAVRQWESKVAVREVDPDRVAIAATVEQAVTASRLLHLHYADSSGAVSEREVEPVGLLTARGDWYLIAWCRLRRADRGFRLDRIRAAQLLPDVVRRRDLKASLIASGVPLDRTTD